MHLEEIFCAPEICRTWGQRSIKLSRDRTTKIVGRTRTKNWNTGLTNWYIGKHKEAK